MYGRNNTPYLQGTFTYGGLSYQMRSGLIQTKEYTSKAPIPSGPYMAGKMRSPSPENVSIMTDKAGNAWFIPISSAASEAAGWTGLGVHPIANYSAGCIGILNANQALYDLLQRSPLQNIEVNY